MLKYLPFAFLIILMIYGCGGSNGPNDGEPPAVNSVSPANNAASIAIDTVIWAVFSEPVKPASVDTGSFKIDPFVAGSFSIGGDTVRFEPSVDLDYATEYSMTLTTDITDTSGNGLAQQFLWSFTTLSDPNLAPPAVLSTGPSSGGLNVEINSTVTATFSKAIASATLTAASFTVSNGVTGTISYSDKTATFTPDSDLSYGTGYTATLTTAVTDTFGIALDENYAWSFATRADPSIPLVYIASPVDSAIVGDTAEITVNATQPNGVEKVVLYINSIAVDSVMNQSGNIVFEYDASSLQIGSVREVTAKAYAEGNEATSAPINIIYLWEEMLVDNNDPWSTDIKKVYARTTTALLELRYESWEDWSFPYPYDSTNDTTYFDPSFNVAIFFDTDFNSLTGRSVIGLGQLNDLGAEYRLIIGLSGRDTAMASPNVSCDTCWNFEFDTTGLARHDVPRDTNVFEIAIPWTDLDNSGEVWMLFIAADQSEDPENPDFDWAPNKGVGHIAVRRLNRYVGKSHAVPITGKVHPKIPRSDASSSLREMNPFR